MSNYYLVFHFSLIELIFCAFFTISQITFQFFILPSYIHTLYHIAKWQSFYKETVCRMSIILFRSHCECDKAFYRCLKRTNSLVSSQIGLTYFSILGPQCFKRDHPIMRCKRRTRFEKSIDIDLNFVTFVISFVSISE